jgi:hypothetical protein
VLAGTNQNGQYVQMRYATVVGSDDGGSRFVDVEVEQIATTFAENVPPLLTSAPVRAQYVVFVTTPDDLRDTQPHPAPRRQLVIALDGEFEIETSDGERRTFPPGGVVLVEDTAGRGHVTRASKGRATFVAVPLSE